MNRGSTLFLRLIICLVAVGAFSALLWFPPTEGRAANRDVLEIYLDPFILFIYLSSLPFFIGLYQAFKLLNLIDANQAFTQSSVNRVKNIKWASLWMIGLIAIAVLFIRFFAHGDDSAGPTMLGIVASLAFGVVGAAAALFQKLLQNAGDIKSENDLTI